MNGIPTEIIKSIARLVKITQEAMGSINKELKKTSELASKISRLYPPQWFELVAEQKRFFDDIRSLKNISEYTAYYQEKIERADFLGRNGWVLTPYSEICDDQFLTEKLQKGMSEKNCSKYYFKNNEDALTSINNTRTIYVGECLLYYNEFEKHFKKRDYTASSFFISALLERRMRYAFGLDTYRKYKAIVNKGVKERKEFILEKLKQDTQHFYSNIIILNEFLPSFEQYAKRTFTEDEEYAIYNMSTGVEPPFFNRNWLMHGRRTHLVERYEVLQLYNALICLEAIIEALESYEILGTNK